MTRFGKLKAWVATPKGKAVPTGAGVFLALYLAVGFGLFWGNWTAALRWPFLMRGFLLRVALMVLLSFAGVGFLIYRLKLQSLLGQPDRVRELEEQLELQRVHTRTLDKSAQDEIHELYVHLEAAKAEAWRATEEKKQGEARVAAAEVKAKAGSIRRAVMRVNSGLLTWAQESMQRRAPRTPG